MVLLTATESAEVARACRCGHVGISSPIRERSSFGAMGSKRGKRRWDHLCKRCRAEYKALLRARMKGSASEQDALIDAWEPRERAGEQLPSLADVRDPRSLSGRKLSRAKTQAFQRWLESLHVTEDGRRRQEVVAAMLDVSDRRLRWWLTSERVDETALDLAATRVGMLTADEILAEYATEPSAPTCGQESACRSPGCSEPTAGGKWCEACSERLQRVKAAVDGDAARFKARIKRDGARATCCSPYCQAPRESGHRFCDACEEAGLSEDDLD